MHPRSTALILIGFQNDYFDPHGLVHAAVDSPARVQDVRDRTLALVEALAPTAATIVACPIRFTADYGELVDPIGILRVIRDVGAFREDRAGGQTIDALLAYGERILEVPGRRGLNAFSNTDLGAVLRDRGIEDVLIAGVLTSVCVDSTAREAADRGYRVTVLADATAGRTAFEQEFYCTELLPLYARVATTQDILQEQSTWTTAATT